jgi:hypothetical protein
MNFSILEEMAQRGSAGRNDALTTAIITVGTVIIMYGGLWLVRELWKIVFGVVAGRDVYYVKAIRSLIGSVELNRGKKLTVVGVGMLGTVFILAICLAGVVYGLHFDFRRVGASGDGGDFFPGTFQNQRGKKFDFPVVPFFVPTNAPPAVQEWLRNYIKTNMNDLVASAGAF